MAIVVAGMSLLQVAQLIAALGGAGMSAIGLVDWFDRHKGEYPLLSQLAPAHELEVHQLVADAHGGDHGTAQDFIRNTLGR